eukprot:7186974-Alexandrium_andersonii.AAC.1
MGASGPRLGPTAAGPGTCGASASGFGQPLPASAGGPNVGAIGGGPRSGLPTDAGVMVPYLLT